MRKVEALLQKERIENEARQAQMMSSIDELLAGAKEGLEQEHQQKLAELSAERKHQERNYKKRVAALQKRPDRSDRRTLPHGGGCVADFG